ncbi:MAG: SDR family oxidoreductase [Bryobacteraceae bacterium]
MDILLTGATGAIGGDLLRCLLDTRPSVAVHVLLRAQTAEEVRARMLPVHASLSRDDAHRVLPAPGDILLDDLGLGANRQDLISRIGEIYHVAACTSLSQTMEDARRTNLLGTEHVIEFARAIRKTGNPVRLHHISTAYVSGTRTGCMREDELNRGQEFFNYYEWSKFEAERAVRKAGADLPVTIYRPGLVVGDSRTGRTSRFRGIYQVLQWIHSGLLDSLPCQPDFQLDLAPVDYVTGAVVRLAQLSDSANKTFHLTAGAGNALPLNELVEIYLRERAACEGGEYRPGSIRFLPPQENSIPADHEVPAIWKRFAHYVPYFTCPKVFDNSVALAALPDLQAPNCREYLPIVVRYALKSGFRVSPAS